MTSLSFVPALMLAFPVVATNLSFNGGFARTECLARTLDLLKNGLLDPDDEVFYHDKAGQPMSRAMDLTLTLSGCKRLCGPKQAWYPDIGPRLSVWLIPVLLLLSNVELSPLDKRRFSAILHLLGDPIDSIWSLISKIGAWNRCDREAKTLASEYCEPCQRVVAMVFAGFEEIEGPRVRTDCYFDNLVKKYRLTSHFHAWRRAAVKLADGRTDEFVRTCLAILLYIFQLVASFVTQVGGGNTSPPGGRIATGVLLSWLIPTVLLSNAVGGFTSRRTCYDILLDFVEQTGESLHISHEPYRQHECTSKTGCRCHTAYFESQSWMGGIYTFRPWKFEHTRSERHWYHMELAIAASPVCVGTIGGFIVLWVGTPIGFNCRHVWLLSVFCLWCLSLFITSFSRTHVFTNSRTHWRFVLAKDFLIAAPSLTIIILSACGLFNSCSCWSGFLYYHKNPHVLLNSDAFLGRMDDTIYPLIVGISIVLQLLIFVLVVGIRWRGLRVMRWSDTARGEEFERILGGPTSRCCGSSSRCRQSRKPASKSVSNHQIAQ